MYYIYFCFCPQNVLFFLFVYFFIKLIILFVSICVIKTTTTVRIKYYIELRSYFNNQDIVYA